MKEGATQKCKTKPNSSLLNWVTCPALNTEPTPEKQNEPKLDFPIIKKQNEPKV
jgi:hypothetical protein